MVKTRPRANPDDPVVVALVDGVMARRDHAAFGQLYDHFVERIYRFLYAWCGSQADAEEQTEQVFVKAWEAIDHDQDHGDGLLFEVWLYRLAHNAHPRQLERTTRSREPEAQLDVDVLVRAVRRLTPKQQEVMLLRFTADLDTGQIAQIMQVSERGVRALQLRGLISLSRILDRQGFLRTMGPANANAVAQPDVP